MDHLDASHGQGARLVSTADCPIFAIPACVAAKCWTLVQDSGSLVRLPEVPSAALVRICEYHADDQTFRRTSAFFEDMAYQDLCDVLHAAVHLDDGDLLDDAADWVASNIRDKSASEIRTFLRLTDSMGPSEDLSWATQ